MLEIMVSGITGSSKKVSFFSVCTFSHVLANVTLKVLTFLQNN